METLRLLVQNLIIIVILAVLLEMLLPNGEMRRYTKMVMGLMVIVAVVQAVSGITGGSLFGEIEEYTWRSAPDQGKRFDILEQGQKINDDNRKKALEQYKKGVERQISALVGVDGKVRLVEADLNIEDDPSKKEFGRIKEVKLRLGREEGVKTVEPISVMVGEKKPGPEQGGEPPPELSRAALKAARTVANFYNLSQEQVKVTYRD